MGLDGSSRGWGTVRFATSEVAAEAIHRFNQYDLDGQTLEVRLDSKA